MKTQDGKKARWPALLALLSLLSLLAIPTHNLYWVLNLLWLDFALFLVPGFLGTWNTTGRWLIRCPECGLTGDAPEFALVRVRSGTTGRQYARCRRCRKWGWKELEAKKAGPDTVKLARL